MRIVDIIEKKRKGASLTREEIRFWIDGVINETIPNYQTSALLMAIAIKGMSKQETYYLTGAMRDSGDILDLSKIDGIKVDKHSTGGVGDKTTLVLAPMLASCGAKVAKLSGRGLGHTGGTLDKLESIKGVSVNIKEEDFISQVNKIGVAIAGQTKSLAPADKYLYALRDVTATVESIPLIASSVMSKKIASGADVILLDVTVGNGAFMKNIIDARKLAELMVKIGNHHHKKVRAIISNMNEPLGYAIGNKLEILEVIDALKGKDIPDLMELVYKCGAILLVEANIAKDESDALTKLKEVISNGKAYDKFVELISAQGGDINHLYDFAPKYKYEIKADRSGYLSYINTLGLGVASSKLGAGRNTKDDVIDMDSGILVTKKVGDYILEGENIAICYTNKENVDIIYKEISDCFTIIKEEASKQKVIIDVI